MLPGHLECPLPALPGLVSQIYAAAAVAVFAVQQILHCSHYTSVAADITLMGSVRYFPRRFAL